MIEGSEQFARSLLVDVERSPEIPAAHLRPPRPTLDEVLGDAGVDAIASAYELGYTMPAIARHLDLHPSTVSRRLSRLRAQIKT